MCTCTCKNQYLVKSTVRDYIVTASSAQELVDKLANTGPRNHAEELLGIRHDAGVRFELRPGWDGKNHILITVDSDDADSSSEFSVYLMSK